MCGIVGATGIDGAARIASLGLYALQHRGQEAAGISAVDEQGHARVHKVTGQIAEGLDETLLRMLPGRTALGHTRYSTAGGAGLINAQPVLARYHAGDLCLVHNGNLTNAATLRSELVSGGAIFQGTIDSEVIVHLIARSRASTPDEQVREALMQCEGAFSVLVTIGDTMYAARDPRGFRPLVLGRLGGGMVAASETCALDLIGARFSCEVQPGEVLRIRGTEVTQLDPLPPAPRQAPCIFELVYFARPDSRVFGASVDRARRAFGRRLAQEHPAPDADCVFSVPDSSNSAALGFSEASGIPLELGLIRNHYVGRTFIHPEQAGRDFQVRIKYNPVKEVIEGKRVVVVDDSLVRGTTSRGLISLIREAGAREVHFRVASPPVTNPCFYGIDMPTKAELIGARLNVDEIARHLNVDSLGYLSLEGMQDAVREFGPFCNACFSGEYTAPLVDLGAGLEQTAAC
ncbi:MAG TPA: amidophosphoribosyltransferase [Longimicrobiales bacterium]|nr:amidophosphoribosyltransferase [Longimicrobiales bacterium]